MSTDFFVLLDENQTTKKIILQTTKNIFPRRAHSRHGKNSWNCKLKLTATLRSRLSHR